MISLSRISAISLRYHKSFNISYKKYFHQQVNEAKLSESKDIVSIKLNNETLKYPSIWLRDNCQCPSCFHEKSQSRVINWEEFDFTAKPSSIKLDGTELTVEWSDDHTSVFGTEWLKERRFTGEKRKSYKEKVYKFEKVTWGSKEFKDCAKEFDYQSVLNQDSVLLDWLESLSKYGVAFVTNVPALKNSNRKLIERVAYVKKTHYGEEFVVRAKEGANNVAYLSANLQLHTDSPYFNYKPGINSLHCIVQSPGEGGKSRLADGFHVGNYMRINHPEDYKILTNTLVDWNDIGHEEGYQFHSIHQAPVLCEDETGELIGVNFTQPQRDSHFNSPLEKIVPWYKAASLFMKLLSSHEYCVNFKLPEGVILIFDNDRLVHGRHMYVDEVGRERMLVGCYLDWDETYSRIRVLRKQLGRSDKNFST